MCQRQSKRLGLKKNNLSKSWRKLIRLSLDQEVSQKLQIMILIEINIFKKDWLSLKKTTKIMSQVQILMIVDLLLLRCLTPQFRSTFLKKEKTQAQSSTHWTSKRNQTVLLLSQVWNPKNWKKKEVLKAKRKNKSSLTKRRMGFL